MQTWQENIKKISRALSILIDVEEDTDRVSTVLEASRALKELKMHCTNCHSELVTIHSIASCGWTNVLTNPITTKDTMTVKDVKMMAMELIKRDLDL